MFVCLIVRICFYVFSPKEDIMLLFNDVKSSADKRGEDEYRRVASEFIFGVNNIEGMLLKLDTPRDMFLALLGEDGYKKLEDKSVNQLLLLKYLSSDIEHRDALKSKVCRTLIREAVMHELPLNSCTSMIAISSSCTKIVSGELAIKKKLPEGDLAFKMASIMLYLFEMAKVFKRVKHGSHKNSHVDHEHSYDIVKVNLKLEEDGHLYKYLTKKLSIEPSCYKPNDWSNNSKGGIASTSAHSGSKNKHMPDQEDFVWNRLNKLQSVEFMLNNSFIGKHMKDLYGTFAGSSCAMDEMDKFGKAIDTYLDKKFYFSYNYGSDNGRIYGNGYLIPSQSGGRNWMTQFANERHLSERGLFHLKNKIADFESKGYSPDVEDMKSKGIMPKKYLEYLNYLDALEKHEKGLPVGNMCGVDGIVMGPQTHAYYTGDMTQYYNTVIDDKRGAMAKELNLTKDEVKGGMSPYTYGGGMMVTIEGVLKFGNDTTMDRIGNWEAFFDKWEELYYKYFPTSIKLRKFLQKLTSKTNLGGAVHYTTVAGFNACIQPLETITTVHKTIYGPSREFTRECIVPNSFGAKIQAASGHCVDSSILAFIIDAFNGDIKPVHDEYCVHFNDVDTLLDIYAEIACMLNDNGKDILSLFVNQCFQPYVEMVGSINVNSLFVGDLDNETIKSNVGIN